MSVAVQQACVDAEDWKSSFLSFVNDRMDEIESNFPMESITDISKVEGDRYFILDRPAIGGFKVNRVEK